ncbi:Beta-barrel assembly-enhancing protease [bacterium HR39]|nr:Beta-barrel assembly-enhancing protease [bacterium HR39]
MRPIALRRAFLLPLLLCAALAVRAAALPAHAATLVRDDEIERYLRTLAGPIFRAAGLAPDQVRLFVVRDPQINAFVAGGQQLFLYTGLLGATETPEQLAGVIAHEAGHMAGGHLVRLREEFERATVQSLVGAVLGAAAALAGAPEVGTAIVLGGQDVAQRNLLAYTRTQESVADQAAVSTLERAGTTPEGLLAFMEILARRESTFPAGGDVYLRTHPLTAERIAALRRRVETSPARGRRLPEALQLAHQRMRAKLEGFLEPPEQVRAQRCGRSDFADRYACAVALFRLGRRGEAEALLAAMLREAPEDPWLHELLGQMRFEGGEVAAAEQPYRRAAELAPDAPLVRIGLVQVLIELDGPERLAEAERHVREALRLDPDNAFAWRLLGTVLGRRGETAASYAAFAEWALRTGRPEDAALYVERARAAGPDGATALRLQDLEAAIARARREAGERRRR